MATALGRFLKKLRLDNDELLFDMAKKIEMPTSTLSLSLIHISEPTRH